MIFNMNSGASKKLPVLQADYPMNVSVVTGKSATVEVIIGEEGYPKEYTYQWYVNDSAVSGATSPTYTITNVTFGDTSVYCVVTNPAGTVKSRTATIKGSSTIPEFTYTGTYEIVDDDDNAITQSSGNWKIRFLTSGTLTFTNLNGAAERIDVFCVGGGGSGGGSDNGKPGGGGGGGYTTTSNAINIVSGTSYDIVVGSGGSAYNGGGSTSAFGVSASGGFKANATYGGDGGSGGAGGGEDSTNAGGSDGSDGEGSRQGTGQGTTTREFGSSSGTLYAGGGGNGWPGVGAGGAGGGGKGSEYYVSASAGRKNLGGGGGGLNRDGVGSPGAGGSGIVVIRNAR